MTIDRVQSYHDGALDANARTAFERDLAASPELRAELDALRALDDDVRRAFTAPSDGQLADLVRSALDRADSDAAPAPVITTVRSRRPALAVAAALLMTITGTWLLVNALSGRGTSGSPYDVGPQRSVWVAYADAARDDWHADWECPPDVFAGVFRDRLGVPLALDIAPDDDMMALGVSYAHVFTPRTTCVLVRTATGHALVIVDRLERDAPPAPAHDALHAHRRELGDLVLYEISPAAAPQVLDAFSIPEADAE